ncbi:MAG: metallophosphoesterase [Bacteroidales bacterium]|nr:metallophosphoesterase [Bacteroidales bacterium]
MMELLITLIMLAFIEAVLAAVVCVLAGIAAMSGHRFRKAVSAGMWILVIPPLVTAYGTLIGRNAYMTVPVDIVSGDIPENFDGYRIVHISDLHLSSFRSRHRSLEKAVEKINRLEPDLIAMTGDLITFSPSEIDGCDTILSRLDARDGVFSVLGNHDYCIYDRRSKRKATQDVVEKVIAAERELGWHVMLNGHTDIIRGNDTISIIGVENTSASDRFPSYGNLRKATEGACGRFKILLSHDPTHWRMEVAGKSDIGLTLSGHTHAMQMSVFGWSPSSLIYDEHRGLYEYCNTDKESTAGDNRQYLYVNIGLGETGFPARIGARPEITVITLHSASHEGKQ